MSQPKQLYDIETHDIAMFAKNRGESNWQLKCFQLRVVSNITGQNG